MSADQAPIIAASDRKPIKTQPFSPNVATQRENSGDAERRNSRQPQREYAALVVICITVL
jgi:hypothetical protein